MIRLTELDGAPVESEAGRRLGTVREVHACDGQVTAIVCGPGSWIERLTARRAGTRIPWQAVRSVSARKIVVAIDGAAKDKSGKS